MAPAATMTASFVRAVHTVVPGRARLHVAGLRRSPAMRSRLERDLAGSAGVQAIAVSAETGNLLVRFDPATPHDRIVERIDAVLRGPAAYDPGQADALEASPQPNHDGAPAWHAMPASEVTLAVGSSEAGLSEADAERRLARWGSNGVPSAPGRSGLAILADQFRGLPVAMLGGAAVLALLTGGGLLEAAAIGLVLLMNGAIGFVTESRSERAIAGLASLGSDPIARVIRGGGEQTIPAKAVVPGDLIVLRRGDLVPADARLLSTRDLSVSEAVLTGESLPVVKDAEASVRTRSPLADRVGMVFRGTAVTGGAATAVVVATGAQTEVGRIQRLVEEVSAPETPMQRQLRVLGRRLVWLSLAVCGVVLAITVLRGRGLLPALRSAVSLAVAALPEGLPAIATTTLAFGVSEMRRRGVLVRRLDAIETLASVSVVCLDKTGTLTMNRMSVTAVALGDQLVPLGAGQDISDSRLRRLLEIGSLCSDTLLPQAGSEIGLTGSATENALVQAALDAGLDVAGLRERHPLREVHYRTESYRFMATVHRALSADPDKPFLVAVKGDHGEVLTRCASEFSEDGIVVPLTPERRAAVNRANGCMAGDALRVLGFAYRYAPEVPCADAGNGAVAGDLTWIGLAGMADPIRPGAEDLVAAVRVAGVRAVMVTGDQAATARALATRLGLGRAGQVEIIDATALEQLPAESLADVAHRADVFARVSPAQKLVIVQALQRAGEVVAMTGDGINDGPALRAADVGIAMGGEGATDAAREVADVVLERDELAALPTAFARGRTTYVNVRKSVHYLLGTNLSEILVVLAAAGAGIREPLSAMQLLWINVISDVLPGIGLALEPPEPGIMARPRPADEPIVRGDDLASLVADGAIIGAGALAAYGFGAVRAGEARGRSLAFGSLIVSQLLHALNCRQDTAAGLQRTVAANRPLAAMLGVSFAAQLAMLSTPGARRLLGVACLGPADLPMLAAAGVGPFLVNRARRTDGRPQASGAERHHGS